MLAEKIPTLRGKKPGFRGDSGDSGPEPLPLFSAASVTSRQSQLGTTRRWKLAGSWASLADWRRSKAALSSFSSRLCSVALLSLWKASRREAGLPPGQAGSTSGVRTDLLALWPQHLPARCRSTWASHPSPTHSNLRAWILGTFRVMSCSHRVHCGFNNGLSYNWLINDPDFVLDRTVIATTCFLPCIQLPSQHCLCSEWEKEMSGSQEW